MAFAGLLVPMEEEHPTLLILGVLLTLRCLVPLLQQQVKDTSLKGSFGVTRKEMEVCPSAEQLVQVRVNSGKCGMCAPWKQHVSGSVGAERSELGDGTLPLLLRSQEMCLHRHV